MRTYAKTLAVAVTIAVSVMFFLSTAAQADSVTLQNSTADHAFVDYGYTLAQSIDGITSGSNGWNLYLYSNIDSNMVWETVTDTAGDEWTFTLSHNFSEYGGYYTFRKIRLYYTTDDRSEFADGVVGGDITANWIVLAPTIATAISSTATINPDNSISWTNAAATDTYTVTVIAALSGVTGFRLEVLTDPTYLGYAGDGNAVLNEFQVQASGVPEPATMALLGLGGFGLLLRRKNQR